MKRKSIAIILGIAFILTIFAGCGTVEGTTTPAMPMAEETVAQVVTDEEQAVVEEAPQKEIQVTTVAKEEKKHVLSQMRKRNTGKREVLYFLRRKDKYGARERTEG